MKYSSFYIKNYKGIKELTLYLDKDPRSNVITLVGLNECGKTSILEALSLLSKELEIPDRHKLIPKAKKYNFNGTIEVHATLTLDESDEHSISDFCVDNGFRQIEKITNIIIKLVYHFRDSKYIDANSGINYEFILRGKKKNQQHIRTIERDSDDWNNVCQHILESELLPPIIYYPNFLFDFPIKIFLETSQNESEEQATYRAVISDIMDTLGENLSIEEHIVKRIRSNEAGIDEALESTIERISAKISNVVFTAWEQLFDSSGKEIRLKVGIDQSKNICALEVRLKDGTEQFQISERSLGFKWFFTFLLFTEFRKNRRREKGEILFLLDEPASNLHSTAQQKLLMTFEKLATDCKLVYTTHSHHLVNPKWLSGAYVVRNKALKYEEEFSFDSAKTDIEAVLYKQFAAKHPEQQTYFQPILDALEYRPGYLEQVPNIILTEGKNDYYTFKYVKEIIFRDRNDWGELRFYPGNGADRNNQIIATYLAWGRDFVILLDGDEAGVKAKRRYEKEFGREVENKILTLSDIDPSFSYATEKLFSESERVEITRYFDPAATEFHKSKFNTALQNLYVEEHPFELASDTISRFEKIFEFIK